MDAVGTDGFLSGRCHGWPMDALWDRMESDLDLIMVGTWMLCGIGWNLILENPTLKQLHVLFCGATSGLRAKP